MVGVGCGWVGVGGGLGLGWTRFGGGFGFEVGWGWVEIFKAVRFNTKRTTKRTTRPQELFDILVPISGDMPWKRKHADICKVNKPTCGWSSQRPEVMSRPSVSAST